MPLLLSPVLWTVPGNLGILNSSRVCSSNVGFRFYYDKLDEVEDYDVVEYALELTYNMTFGVALHPIETVTSVRFQQFFLALGGSEDQIL